MLSLNRVLFVLMPFAAAIASSCAGYEWSPQVIQLKVPATAAAEGAAADAAPADAAAVAPAAVAAELAAGADDTAAEQAARKPPTPTAAPAAAVTLRNCR